MYSVWPKNLNLSCHNFLQLFIIDDDDVAVIHEDHDAFPTCVECCGDNYLIVGDVAGRVHLG